jgi:hypothetical protein
MRVFFLARTVRRSPKERVRVCEIGRAVRGQRCKELMLAGNNYGSTPNLKAPQAMHFFCLGSCFLSWGWGGGVTERA